MWPGIHDEGFWKMAVTFCIFAVATVHVCLISIARLVGRFRWVSFIGYQLIYGLALVLAVAMVGEISSEGMWRFIAALSIVVAAITLVIPILYRIGRMDGNKAELLMPTDQRNVASIDEEIARLGKRIQELQHIKAAIISDVV